MWEDHYRTAAVTMIILLFGWAGFSLESYGKSIARIEVKLEYAIDQIHDIKHKDDLARN